MKVIKPQKLGVLTRSFEHQRADYLGVAILAFVPLESVHRLMSEVSMWQFLPEQLGRDAMLDAGMPKSRAEYLVTGIAYPPGQQPAATCPVRVEVGPLVKELSVIGDRVWEKGVPTHPAVFTEMSLGWERSFGGPSEPRNPLGKGADLMGVEGEDSFHPMPNIEAPGRLLRTPAERPEPVGLGPLAFDWPQRFGRAGTYDEAWVRESFPGFANDMDWRIFNLASEDQHLDGYFRGDEGYRFEGLHPERVIEGTLPRLQTRCFINRQTAEGERLDEIAMRLTTAWFFPHAERAVLVFHGSTQVEEDDASDVLQLMVGGEELDQPKPREHYESVLRKRLDPEKGYLEALNDGDLTPQGWEEIPDPTQAEMAAALETEGLMSRNMRKRREREHEKARRRVAEMGLDPDEYVPPLEEPEVEAPPADMSQLGAYIDRMEEKAQELQAMAEKKRVEAEARARQVCAEAGVRFEDYYSSELPAGPPQFSAEAQLKQLEMQLESAREAGVPMQELEERFLSESYREQLLQAELKGRDAYRQMAHFQGAAPRLEGEGLESIRRAITQALAAGRSLVGWDLTGADLRGLDLVGECFDHCFMESANLAGMNLAGCSFENAVLTRADLSGAILTGANLQGANLGEADLSQTRIDGGARLQAAILGRARLHETDLTGAQLEGADFMEAKFTRANLKGVMAPEALFMEVDLGGTCLEGALLTKAIFLKAKVQETNFAAAQLEQAVFLETEGRGVVFRGAHAQNLRVVKDCDFSGADFVGADLGDANLRGTRLVGADLSGAQLGGADLSECDLEGSKLYRAVAKSSRFEKANLTEAHLVSVNLMEASLQKARLAGADLRGANLFEADFSRVLTDDRTDFTDALQTGARYLPLRKP